jgi:hypothetical protein
VTEWFYRSDEEWNAIAQRLKLTACPFCQVVGTLNRHGALYGFDESSHRPTVRARRVFCSNRNTRPGCGHTFSVWLADKIRRLSLSTAALWAFVQCAVADGIIAAIGASDSHRSERTWLRVWKRFVLAQSQIRTALAGRCPPPGLPAERRPAAHVLAHLQAAFLDADPIAAFQHTLRTFFV